MKSETEAKLVDERKKHASVIEQMKTEYKKKFDDANLENKKYTELLLIKLKAKTAKINELENKYGNDERSKDNENKLEIEENQNKVNELINKSNAMINLKKFEECIK